MIFALLGMTFLGAASSGFRGSGSDGLDVGIVDVAASNIFPVSRFDHLKAGRIVCHIVRHPTVRLSFDNAVLGPDQVIHGAVRASEVVADTPVGLHLISAVLVRVDLEVDLLRESANLLLESVTRHHLEIGLAVSVYLVPVQNVTGEVDQPRCQCRSFGNLGLDSVLQLQPESTEL